MNTKRYLKDLVESGCGERVRWNGMGGAKLEGVVLYRSMRDYVLVLFDTRDEPSTVPASELTRLTPTSRGRRVADALDCASAVGVDPFEPYPS